MVKTVNYKGETLPLVESGIHYGVYKRKSALNGKWFIYRADGVLIGCAQYRVAARGILAELENLAGKGSAA